MVADSSSSSKLTPRTSCDVCRFRKTSCDRNARMAQGVASVCSFCERTGLACKISATSTMSKQRGSKGADQRGKTRMGKRIRHLMESKEREALATSSSPSASPSSPSTSSSPIKRANRRVSTNTGEAVLEDVVKRQNNLFSIPDHEGEDEEGQRHKQLPRQPQLLGVRGLSVDVLLACFDAYFDRTEFCISLSMTYKNFMARARARLYHLTGGTAFKEQQHLNPASDLLLIAVACRGVRNTTISYRFELQDDLETRFITLVKDSDALYNAGLDGLEAVKLMAELRVRGLHPVLPGSSHPSPLHNDVLGRGFTVTLALSLGVHTGPLAHLNERENERRRYLFFGTYVQDALRSVSARELYRVSDHHIGWPPPVKRSRDDGAYGLALCGLAVVARKMCAEMLSPRARSKGGVAASTVDMILNDLAAWHTDPNFDGQVDYVTATECGDIRFEARRCYALTTSFALQLTLFSFVNDFGLLEDGNDGLAGARLFSETLNASSQLAKVASRCTRMDLIDATPNILRNVPAAFVLWIAWTVANRSWQLSQRQLSEMYGNALELITCVRSAKSRKDSESLASALQRILDRSFRGPNTTNHATESQEDAAPFFPYYTGMQQTFPSAQTHPHKNINAIPATTTSTLTDNFLGDLEQEMLQFCAAMGLDLPNNPSTFLPDFDLFTL